MLIRYALALAVVSLAASAPASGAESTTTEVAAEQTASDSVGITFSDAVTAHAAAHDMDAMNDSSSKFERGVAGAERSEPPVGGISGGSLRSTPATRIRELLNLF